MSRIGKNPVLIPDGVEVSVSGQNLKVKGKLGELSMVVHEDVAVAVEDGEAGKKQIRYEPRGDKKGLGRSLWATMRTLGRNMVDGVSKGYTKKLEITGVGYRAQLQGQDLLLQLGYSHEVRYKVPQGIKIEMEKQTSISITGIDKQRVGQVAAEIISWRPPEPYKGKGIKHEGQEILRKEGKKK